MNPLQNLSNRVGKNNLIAIVVIILLLIVAFFLLSGRDLVNKFVTNQPTVSIVPSVSPSPTPTTIPGDTIMITDRRASPKSLTIKRGYVLTFANFSGARIDIEGVDNASKDLNIGVLEDNETSKEVMFTKTGIYNYINKLNPTIVGEVIVTD